MYVSHFAYIQTREQEILGNRFPARKHLHFRPNDGSKPPLLNHRLAADHSQVL
jgi:hypothetical protein